MEDNKGFFDVTLDQVPLFLRDGDYFKTLSTESYDHFSVPRHAFKTDISINSVDDLASLLNSMQYWIVHSDELVSTCTEYCFSTLMVDEVCQMIDLHEISLPFMRIIRRALEPMPLYLIKFVRRTPSLCAIKFESHINEVIANNLRYLDIEECDRAVIAYLKLYDLSSVAAEGRLDIVQYMYEHKLNGLSCRKASERGQLDCLKYLHSIGRPWGVYVPAEAALHGHLECLVFAHERGCSWDFETCVNAAKMGNLACLQYAHENGCPWEELRGGWQSAIASAARGGHIDCFQYAYANGCPLRSCAALDCVEGGSMVFLQVFCEQGHKLHEDSCSIYAANGNLQCLQYAREHGGAWDKSTCSNAARNGHLDCLQYAHQNGCPWSYDTTQAAIKHFPCLEYALRHGCPHFPDLAISAFQARCDDSGFYLVANYSIFLDIYTYAAGHGRVDILEACVAAGIPWHEEVCSFAEVAGEQACLEYAQSHGASFPITKESPPLRMWREQQCELRTTSTTKDSWPTIRALTEQEAEAFMCVLRDNRKYRRNRVPHLPK